MPQQLSSHQYIVLVCAEKGKHAACLVNAVSCDPLQRNKLQCKMNEMPFCKPCRYYCICSLEQIRRFYLALNKVHDSSPDIFFFQSVKIRTLVLTSLQLVAKNNLGKCKLSLRASSANVMLQINTFSEKLTILNVSQANKIKTKNTKDRKIELWGEQAFHVLTLWFPGEWKILTFVTTYELVD